MNLCVPHVARNRAAAARAAVLVSLALLGGATTLAAEMPAPRPTAIGPQTAAPSRLVLPAISCGTGLSGPAAARPLGSVAAAACRGLLLPPVLAPDALRLETRRATGSGVLIGAVVGFVVGAGATHLILNSGGSTSLCDRSANQDAMSRGECLGLTALGGAAGAGIGALIGSRVSR